MVVYSLFEEQIESDKNALDHYLAHGTESYAESLTYLPEPVEYRLGEVGQGFRIALEILNSGRLGLAAEPPHANLELHRRQRRRLPG